MFLISIIMKHLLQDIQTFDGLSNLSDVEIELVELITDQLVEDIFNKAVINW